MMARLPLLRVTYHLQETCKDGQGLSMLNPSMLFVVMCNMGFCTSSCRHVKLISRLWHLHTWASQV